MMFKILWLGVFIVLGFLFAGANARNLTNLSVLLHTFRDVPVYLCILPAFVAGILWSIPFFLLKTARRGRKKPKKPENGGAFSAEETGE